MLPLDDQKTTGQKLELRDYLQILDKRRWTIFTVFLIVFILIIIVGLRKKTPLYTSTSTILLERSRNNGNTGLGMYYSWDPEFLPTQTEIIKSRKVARRVVDNLDLVTRYHNHFFPEKKTKTSTFAAIKATVFDYFSFLLHPDQTHSPVSSTSNQGKLDNQASRIADIIKGRIKVESIKDTRVVNIHYTDTNPSIAKLITDAIVQAYIEESLEIKLSSTKQSLKWMASKAQQERATLEKSEKNLQKFMREHNLVTLENRLAIYPEKLGQISTQLSNAQAERQNLEALHQQIAGMKKNPEALERIPFIAKNKTLQSIRDQILKAEQRIKELSKKYGPKHPNMIKAVDDRNILIKEKKQEIERIVESADNAYELAKSKEKNLKKLLASTKNEFLEINENFVQSTIMKREVDANRALYETLTSNIKKTSVTQDSQSVNIWVMREASIEAEPSNVQPKRVLLIAFVLSLASGIGIALFVEYLDNTIKSSEEIEQRYGLTVLGTVQATKKGELIEKTLLDDTQSSLAESYRMIRSSLLLSSADRPPRTIAVTSMTSQEGKTSTALNLARTMAQISEKVLLIDADMRKPRIHTLFNLTNISGLSTFLSGNTDEEIVHCMVEDNLSVITSGIIPPNPAELLSSTRMKMLLESMEQDYDFIFIDTPPISHLADGLIISTLVDGTVLVARAGKITYDIFNDGLKKLQDFKPHILGVILNRLRIGHDFSRYDYRYYNEYNQYSKINEDGD